MQHEPHFVIINLIGQNEGNIQFSDFLDIYSAKNQIASVGLGRGWTVDKIFRLICKISI